MPGKNFLSIKSNPTFASTRETLGRDGTGARALEESDVAVDDAAVGCLDSSDIAPARGSGACALGGVEFKVAESLEWTCSRYLL